MKTASDFLARLAPPPDIILADDTLPQLDALCALRCVQERAPDIPLIVVTGPRSDEAGVACLTQGAAIYLLRVHPAAADTAGTGIHTALAGLDRQQRPCTRGHEGGG